MQVTCVPVLLFECNVIWIFAKETFKTNLPSEKWGINKALESSTSDSGNSNEICPVTVIMHVIHCIYSVQVVLKEKPIY